MVTHSSWDDLFEESYPRLFACAYRRTNGKADLAEDFVQETFLRVLRSRNDPGELDIPLAYFFRALRSVVIDHARKARHGRPQSLTDLDNVENQLPVTHPTIQRDLENEEILKAIRLNPGRLSPRERRLFDLLAEGNSCADISETYQIDPRIVRCEINALIAKLKYRYAHKKNKGNQKKNKEKKG